MPAYRQQIGEQGENAAAAFLEARGFSLLGRNLRCKFGEIDLLMQDGETVVVVEVKCQRSSAYTDPLLKVDHRKQQKLARLAEWVSLRYPDSNIRIDVVTVCLPNDIGQPLLAHYPNCIIL